jgi:hypothetical protein
MDPRELDRLYQRMDTGFNQVNERLDIVNGRTRTNEIDIGILKDRAGAGKAAVAGGGVAGLVMAIIEGIKWLGKP